MPTARDRVPPPRTTAAGGPQAADGRWVRRSRLLARLAGAADTPVVLVSAPAGAGKSTLVGQWLDQEQRQHALLRVAPHLDDPAALADALVELLAAIGPDAPEARTVVTAAEPTHSATLLPALELLAGSRSQPYLLVLDDVHLLGDPRCHAVLGALCDGMPRGSQVALVGRGAGPPCLARARAAERLLEFGPADLAFDPTETMDLFHRKGLELSEEAAARLVERADGWAVGLYLIALAARGSGQGQDEVVARLTDQAGSARFVTDYLQAQVLDPLDADTRAFLRRTAVLTELSGPLCDAVLETGDAAVVLADLHRRTRLVVDLEDRPGWFRYHHLLADALRDELRTREPGLEASLHRRAAQWYASGGDLDAAIRHAKAAGDLAFAADLIWSDIVASVGSGRPDRLRQWLSGLSDGELAADRWLALAAAWSALQGGQGDRMVRWQLAARRHAGPDWLRAARTDGYPAQLAVLETVIAPDGLAAALAAAEAALVGLPADSGFRAPAAFISGVVRTLQRDTEQGLRRLVEAERLARAVGVPIVLADSLSWQGVLAVLAGDRPRGGRLIGQATDVIRRNHLERLATSAHALTGQALLLALRHDVPGAGALLATVRRMDAVVTDIAPWYAVCGRLVQARAAVLIGDGALARQLIAEADDRTTPDLAETLVVDLRAATVAALRALTVDGVHAKAITAAELRVLQFLPSHLTLGQISDLLFLSPNTVKTHALSIYRKLGVASRAAAVERARALGLVETVPVG